ncbi:hypothetical protein AAEY27_03255 [Kosakonia sp. BYX6]|uniref:Uncharacterized protein n=1 Tax=Kosakonia calanthes TaxID=3139408 RepID=A0ABZ3B6H1_9ENTR
MHWKIITFIMTGVFIFVLGLWLGSFQTEWAKPENKDAVAYLAMIGGWVSGMATLFAVIISLYASYQASQSNVEQVQLSLEVIPAIDKNDIGTNIIVKNMKPITVHILKIFIAIDGSKASAEISDLKRGGGPIPHALYQLGEKWEFAFYTHYSPQWAAIFSKLESGGGLTFKKGFFIIESAMRQYRLKMPSDLLNMLRTKYETFEAEKEDNKRTF